MDSIYDLNISSDYRDVRLLFFAFSDLELLRFLARLLDDS